MAADSEASGVAFDKNTDTIVILPLANYSGTAEAKSVFIPLIELYLTDHNYKIINSLDTREILREYRIRSAGTIGRDDAAAIRQESGADYLLLGSIDFFDTRFITEAGLSARILDAKTNKIVWAKSVSATGEDFSSLFGLGLISSIDSLAARLVSHLFENISDEMATYAADVETDKLIYGIVPFDNMSPDRYAGDIINSVMISELITAGREVLEPGFILELFRENNRQARGQINSELLHKLYDTYSVNLVLTGTVDKFQPGRAGAHGAAPDLAFGSRLIDTKTGLVLAAYDMSDNGAKHETIFRQGKIKSLGQLTQQLIDKMINRLESEKKKWYAWHN